MPPAETALIAIGVLLAKHLVADFFLQTQYQLQNKGKYGHPGGLLHSGIHAVLTLPVFAVLPPPGLALAASVVVGEMVVHYHLDWLKEQLVAARGWTTTNDQFWWAIGSDQYLHGMTYVGMVWILLPAS
jgi:hypothetical protein